MANHQFGVHHFEAAEALGDVAGGENLLSADGESHFLVLGVFDSLLEVDLLDVENHVGDILLDSGHGVEFAAYAVDFYRCDGVAFEGGKQHATKSVTHGFTIAWFQGLEFELAVAAVGLDHHYRLGFLEC